jgi:glycosyltransferase involved in cell wall biosynthesis
MMTRKPRIFYIGMVATEAYACKIREELFVGAAANKMAAVVSALRQVGRRGVLVSLPFVTRGPTRQPGLITRKDGFPACFLPVHRSAVLRKIFGSLALGRFALRHVQQRDIVLVYNHGIEYIFCLLILRLRKIAVFQDIEDVPTGAESGLRGILNAIAFRITFAVTSPRKVTVSNQVGRNLALADFLALQGVAASPAQPCDKTRRAAFASDGPFRVHYGGTLIPATGLDLFCATLLELEARSELLDRHIEVVVTGAGDLDRLQDLACRLRSGRLRLQLHREIDRAGYFGLLNSCHASLSLKIPDAELAQTTFPSKVIEITSHGLALISTRVSDVEEIFSEDEIWLLRGIDPLELADNIITMAANPDLVRDRAMAGQARTQERFAPTSVGRMLAAFLEAGP